ncbi:MAG: EamA family transporter [Candidatus Methanoperedens sp.]|nr:EamA family transporter [Candidatus Methanoperedens sp.]
MSHLRGYSQVVTACILYGLIGIFIELIGDMPIGSIIFYRLLFGLAAITLYLAVSGRFFEMKLKEKKSRLLMLGLFEAVAVLAYFYSVRYTSVSMAVLLLYTAPIYVSLLSPLLLKEKSTSRSIIALALSITGVVMIVQPQILNNGNSISGVAFGLASGLLYGLMIMTSRSLKDNYTGIAQATWSMIVSLIIFSPFAFAISADGLKNDMHLLILFGLIPTAIGGILYFNGLRLVKAQSASIISLLEPLSAVVLAFIILSEPVAFTTVIGGGFILLGAGILSREGKSKNGSSAGLQFH